MPKAEHILGLKSVGVVFTYDKDPTTGEMQAHHCSASVVQSPGHDLILTAHHCVAGNSIFVPWYRTESPLNKQQYGFYRVERWFADPRYGKYNNKDPESDLDFAFAQLATSSSGKKVQDVVGANSLARTPGFNNNVTMVGYPTAKHDSEDHAVRCPTQTWAVPNQYQIQALCSGMYGGVSGGPWFSKVDWNNGTGEIIGNVGGYNGGGNDQNVDWVTYSPMHGDSFFQLYDDAKNNRPVERPQRYKQPPLPYSMGGGSTWEHAKLMASGDFTGKGRSDLIVVWTDGEVTLYNSNGRGGFDGERRLMKKNNGTWNHAEGITAGDFTGSSQFDLLVRWSDGEVTLYGDVGSKGLDWAGTQMIDPTKTDTWKHATQITAGRFIADKYVTDLMVRWSDGELTLYTNVGAEKKFAEEHKLKDSKDTNKAWQKATLLTAGEYGGSSKWDLLVRWEDGSINSYVGTTTGSLGATHTVHGGNFGTWTHSTVMTTGNFTGNGRTDDLIIRWSDGETSLYQDTTTEHLGTEINLVPQA
ncbi:hypothetical protein GCM10010357_68880 [Streptomyces luteireticuli]|uniref:Peptidase S1 domain-containing protein n=2 Tax=Streptomyces luteireticuli TaxID=173858 RepID=A0ABP3J1Q5_9ACTN